MQRNGLSEIGEVALGIVLIAIGLAKRQGYKTRFPKWQSSHASLRE